MTLYERYDALMREEWQKSTDGLQNERALARLVDEAIGRAVDECAQRLEQHADGGYELVGAAERAALSAVAERRGCAVYLRALKQKIVAACAEERK